MSHVEDLQLELDSLLCKQSIDMIPLMEKVGLNWLKYLEILLKIPSLRQMTILAGIYFYVMPFLR